ncbi:HAD family acid phosphatase [Nocardia asteroides]|uniref:HAD family acid phosphatase n=1 Tax=Nocardia asteroides TaxID=1824 RepID=UPI0004C238F0|nr:HAD family acid phosphatase [Nocardia asteroides]UGT50202.1 phosphatase [Nocardia asteroides]SFN15648.1 HAD superfamily, subfamily IIIB (Acid phosphatase) [Nocardia asteroides]VEG37028.1 vegetative storage protein [Nocardia asteroides]
MKRVTASLVVGVAAVLLAPLPAAGADTGSSSLSGGGSSSLSGNKTELPPYAQWLGEIVPVVAEAKTYLAGRLPGATKPAIVFDIDNTTLETSYNTGLLIPAIQPVRELAIWAKQNGAAIIFVTGRPALVNAYSEANLTSVGYPVDDLYGSAPTTLSAGNAGLAEYKTASRADIEGKGYTIVANIGNSPSDLSGGHAERTFKFPDYNGALN